MQEIDLWADDPLPDDFGVEPQAEQSSTQHSDDDTTPATIETEVAAPVMGEHEYHVRFDDPHYVIWSTSDLSQHKDFHNFNNLETTEYRDGLYYTVFRANPFNSFVLVKILAHQKVDADTETRQRMVWGLRKCDKPQVFMSDSGKNIEISFPKIPTYTQLLRKVNAFPIQSGNYRMNVTRVPDLMVLSENMDSTLPPFEFHEDVVKLHTEPIEGYDGTVESLQNIPIDVLNTIQSGVLSWKVRSKSKKTLAERCADFGIKTLHDLMFWLPRRYIDKTEPQSLYNLIEGESATIVGVVKSSSMLSGDKGVRFQIDTNFGETVPVTFFRQNWLKQKFPEGSDVLVTGRFGFFNRRPQLTGATIESAEEAAAMPIVPIYNQSESRGITTQLLMAATREMMSRLGGIKLPEYFQHSPTSLTYAEALEEIHFPTSLDHHRDAMNTLAYYELVYLQLIIQEMRENSEISLGISQLTGERQLQAKAIRGLPFSLTTSQKKAVLELNQKLADDHPSATLLNADVGSGKTMVSQLACLQSVDAGHQATMIAPTDILGQQLYQSMLSLIEPIKDEVRVEYMNGTMKVREKRALLKDLASGDIDILIGTHAIMGDTVKFKSLGFIAVDEQQKFGAEQRSALLASRDDDRIPDLLLQTATPIPRSTAQVLYGDMTMLELNEKPPGRLPIVTEWIEADPVAITEELVNDIWTDIIREAELGHQTFIITPMVADTGNIEAASVEKAYKNLKDGALSALDVGYTHGKMKAAEQQETMEKFRNGDYDVLVASTVVEVGVDIKNATRIVVLSADRLGASSLHQIRGRVGRNTLPSKCYLVSLGNTENSRIRLESLVKYDNGFDVAKVDLVTRGEGSLFGTTQSGKSDMIFASLVKNSNMIQAAQDEAKRILASPHREQALHDSRQKFATGERLY